jgi:transglutaminase-like putative cysteine protease
MDGERIVEMSVGCQLRYNVPAPTYCVFKIEAANTSSQRVQSEVIELPFGSCSNNDSYVAPVTANRYKRVLLPSGPIEITYRAEVEVDTTGFDPNAVSEFAFGDLPMDALEFVAPSRYCPSDTFTQFAFDTFGQLAGGYSRITAICDWIFSNIAYQQGSSGPSTDAGHAFQSKQGVCRDFAHLGISLTRAVGVPARYASVYADRLVPQDFHAVFEAYLNSPSGGRWFAFDATRMSSPDAVVRIAVGRDAADVAFAWPQGEVKSTPPSVWADAQFRSDGTITQRAMTD